MIKRLFFFLALVGASTLCSAAAVAGNAGLLLSPTRVVLEDGARFVSVTVRNSGDATGRYKIEIVDADMAENGGIKLRDDGSKNEFSAVNLISLSPSSMTLRADESQVVRLLVKNLDTVPDGEYRSHLQVRMTENDLDSDVAKPAEGAGISIKSKMTTVIPIIIRKGQTTYNVAIENAKLVMGGGDKTQAPEVKVAISFSGNRSVLGDVKVTHIAPDGKETQLAFMRGIAIYRNVAKRTQDVVLDVPAGLNIHNGKLRVGFLSQENEGSHVLSEKDITP